MNDQRDCTGPVVAGIRRPDLWALSALSLLCVAISAFLGIHGEFPLNDDWAYAEAVQHLIETGKLERVGWTWIPMIPHALVGWFISTLFGSSWESLRLSNVLMAWAGVLGTYALCRQVGLGSLPGFLAATVIAVNPMHVNLGHTFMTDVPFATITTWSLVFFCRGLRKRAWVWIGLGILLAEAAVLSRQPGLAIPMAFVMVLIATGPAKALHLLVAAATIALTLFVHFEVPWLMMGPRDSGGLFGFSSLADSTLHSPYLLWNVGVNSLAHISYLGIFLGVGVIALLTGPRVIDSWILLSSLVLTGLGIGVILAYSHHLSLPLGLNLINRFGLGPTTLHGEEVLPQTGAAIWWVLTVIGLFSGFVILAALLHAAWKQRHKYLDRPDCLLLALIPVIYMPPILALSRSFDRYLLPMLPPLIAMLLLLAKETRFKLMTRSIAQAAVLALMAVYSVVGSRDYLEHHRCRWAALDQLVASGIDPSEIDGGFEFNCRYDFRKVIRAKREEDVGYQFLVSHHQEMEGYRVVSRHSWRRLFPPGEPVITVFEIDK